MTDIPDNGPVYVILGGSGGIGSEVARLMIASGARLMLAARDTPRLEALATDLAAGDSSRVQVIQAEVTNSASINAVFEQAVARFGRVDGAAHCVGSLLLKPAHLTTDEEWQSTLALNLSSAFYVLRAAIKAMQPTGAGSLVFCSTVAAQVGLANHEAIAAAKGGIDGLVMSAAATYANRGVRVNAVAPGLVRTPMTSRLTSNETSLKASTAMHPLGRIGEPIDIANAIAFLLSAQSNWITGQVINIDGGMSTVRPR